MYRFHCSTPILVRLYTAYTSRIWARDSESPRAGVPEENLPKLILGGCRLEFLGDCSRPQSIAIPATLAQVAASSRASCVRAASHDLLATAVFAHPTDATGTKGEITSIEASFDFFSSSSLLVVGYASLVTGGWTH